MLKTIKFIPFITLLVLNMVIVSCGSANENEDNKKRLEAKINEGQKLIKDFKENFLPEQGKKFEENLAKAKISYSSYDWDAEIRIVEELKKELELSQDSKRELANYLKAIEIIKPWIPDLSAVQIEHNKTNQLILNYLAILYNIREQGELLRNIK